MKRLSSIRQKWWLLYYLLAGFDIVAVAVGLYHTHRLLEIYSQSIQFNELWNTRLGENSELGRIATLVDAPGNDVFDSKDVASESARTRAAHKIWKERLNAFREELRTQTADADCPALVAKVTEADNAMDELIGESDLIYAYLEQNQPDKAGERMATMDRKFARVTNILADLRDAIRAIQFKHLEEQHTVAKSLQKFEYLIAALILLMVLGALVYGRKTARKMQHVDEEIRSLNQELESRVAQRTAALKHSEERLAAAQRMAHVGSWDWDVITGEVIWSDEEYRLFGFAPGECTPSYDLFLSCLHPEARAGAIAWVNKVLSEKKSSSLDLRVVLPDGAERILQSSADVVLAEAGNVARVVGTSQDITERQRAETALRKSEERFQIVSRATNDAIWDWDLVTNTVSFSKSFEKLFGYAPGDFTPIKFWIGSVHPEDRGALMANVKEFLASPREVWSDEYRFRCADGSYAFVLDRGYALRDKEGKPYRIVGSMMNITERKATEEALQRLAGIVEFSDDAILSKTLDGRIVTWNRAAEQLYGYSAAEAIGASVMMLIPEDRLGDEPHIIGRLKHGEVIESFETVRRRKDGRRIDVSLTISAVKGADGRIIGASHIARDITQQKRDRALKEGQNRVLAALAAGAPLDEALTILVRTIETQLDGALCSILLLDDERKRLRVGAAPGLAAAYNDAIDGLEIGPDAGSCGTAVYRKERVITRDIMTDPAWTEFRELALSHNLGSCWSEPIVAESGAVLGTLAMYFTHPREPGPAEIAVMEKAAALASVAITRKRIECELVEARDLALQSTRMKSEFLANMSHEIRTPMNGIIGMTELALETDLDRSQREYLGMVKSSAQSLLGFINDILDFSKIEAGKLELEEIDFSLRDCLGGMLKPLGFRAEQKGLALFADIAPEVPDRVVGDPTRLRQILINLTDNAIKFTERGEVVVRVRNEPGKADENYLHFSVSDTGIGIPPGKQQAIFEAFAQVDSSTTRNYGGTGLGLSIASQLIQKMDGRIWLESTLGEGSTFHFTARLGPASGQLHHDDPPQANAADKIERPREGPLRILVAEDNEINRAVVTGILEKEGHSLAHVKNGDEAVRAAGQESFDLVLMDVQMPGMDGFEATRAIRDAETGNGRRTRIVAMTAHAMKGDRENCLAAGMDDYISKPIRKEDLLGVLPSARKPRPGVTARKKNNGPPKATVATLYSREELIEQCDGDEELMEKLIALFRENTPPLLEAMQTAISRDDGVALAGAAHKLLSSLGAFGAVGARELTQQLEAEARRPGLAGAQASLKKLEYEIDKISGALAAYAPALA